eukprot:CAMPEP_0182433928 /NCGR_PEP_ID=MMETSP1167-20130531/66493_1 /TAXON_ID=2988 /ORGANISM="Mallomonas Sp, Strain CCMP3275" /LENGTH=270 /DNA_ID=CAMNT_0024623203 /DNA_START=86 /DNA_END=895 /DNA_ORIENTATION=-
MTGEEDSRTRQTNGAVVINQISSGLMIGSLPYWEYSYKLLNIVCSLDPSCCDEPEYGAPDGRENLMMFLNGVSALSLLDLSAIDLSSIEAVCFFCNIFHTLLMHARLLLSPPHKKHWSSFFGMMCYEIGNDVFSLSELEQCVLRGHMTTATNPPDLWPPVLSRTDGHYVYALTAVDIRINFIINNGSKSNPSVLFNLMPDTFYSQIKVCSQLFVSSGINIDVIENTVTLPTIFKIFRDDFGSDPLVLLRHCLRYLEQQQWEKLSTLLADN